MFNFLPFLDFSHSRFLGLDHFRDKQQVFFRPSTTWGMTPCPSVMLYVAIRLFICQGPVTCNSPKPADNLTGNSPHTHTHTPLLVGVRCRLSVLPVPVSTIAKTLTLAPMVQKDRRSGFRVAILEREVQKSRSPAGFRVSPAGFEA